VLHEDHLVGAVWRVILDRAGERYVAMRYYPRRFVGFYLTAKAAKQAITQHLGGFVLASVRQGALDSSLFLDRRWHDLGAARVDDRTLNQ